MTEYDNTTGFTAHEWHQQELHFHYHLISLAWKTSYTRHDSQIVIDQIERSSLSEITTRLSSRNVAKPHC